MTFRRKSSCCWAANSRSLYQKRVLLGIECLPVARHLDSSCRLPLLQRHRTHIAFQQLGVQLLQDRFRRLLAELQSGESFLHQLHVKLRNVGISVQFAAELLAAFVLHGHVLVVAALTKSRKQSWKSRLQASAEIYYGTIYARKLLGK